MLLLKLPQLQLWTDTYDVISGQVISNYVYVLVLTLACIGGCLHGCAMAIRKKYGEGIEKYWLEWKWWVGTILDGFAGVMIWPAMPYVPVHLFAPLIIVVQLGTSYILGLIVFAEKCIMKHNIGVLSAAAGIIGVSLSTSHEAAHYSIEDFWAGWVTTRFILTNVTIAILLGISFPVVHRSTFWALMAAGCEGIQYICSRAIVDSIFEHLHGIVTKPAVAVAFIIKGLCILGILHFQQLGLEGAPMSKIAGIYLVGCVLFTCVEGAAYFGDEIPQTLPFAASLCLTLAGIWLLNQKDELEKEGKQVDDVEGNPQDPVFQKQAAS